MPRESTIQILRSTTTDVPTGLTFGELAYSQVNNKMFVGDATGNSIWVGAGITDGSIATNSGVLIPTQSAVKTYVDNAIGGGSGVVNTINATGGAITITGDAGAITNIISGKSNTFTARVATSSLTGVASFNSTDFTVASGAVAIKGAVTSLNGLTGARTLTGDGGALQGINNTIIGARLATDSLTGVASFNSTDFTVTNGNVVLNTGKAVLEVRDGVGFSEQYFFTDPGTLPLTLTGGPGISVKTTSKSAGTVFSNTGVLSFNGATGTVNYYAPIASVTTTGAASFSSTNFDVSGAGAVSIKSGGVPNAALANSCIIVRDEAGATDAICLGETLTITGGIGVDFLRTGTDTFQVRGMTATSSVLGVASFNSTDFTVASGAVSIKGAVTSFNGATGAVTFYPVLATSSVTGVASFNSTDFTVAANGAVALKGAVTSLNGLTGARTLTGDGGAIRGDSNTAITARVATSSLTGVASFDSNNFTVTNGAVVLKGAVTSFNGATGAVSYYPALATTGATGVASFDPTNFAVTNGAVSIKTGGVPNTALVNSSITVAANGNNTINLGSTLTITGTANQVSVSSSSGTVTLGLPNDITIPGNLTVNGTVVTANVDSFVVEDPLFMLGTGNSADSVDIGFYGKYVSSGTRFTGLFRDASDSGKYKLFANLTGGAEPTSFVNDAGAGYSVATLVAKIDGGTF